MATQPLSDDVLNDTSGFPDTPGTSEAASAENAASEGDDDILDLTDDQALDDSAAQEGKTPEEKAENPVEKRIKGALKARDEARNALENEKAARAELEKRLAAIETRMTPKPGEEGAAADEPKAPNPEDYEFGALDQKYIDDSIVYRTQIGIREALKTVETQFQEQQQQKAQQAQAQEAITAAKDIVAKGAALYDDFEEVVWERGLREEYKLDAPTFEAIRESEHPAEIAYALASDPAEAERVFNMTPAQQAKYVFQKDQELAGKKPRATKAPPPPGQQTRGQSGRFTTPADTDDLEAFEKEFYKKK